MIRRCVRWFSFMAASTIVSLVCTLAAQEPSKPASKPDAKAESPPAAVPEKKPDAKKPVLLRSRKGKAKEDSKANPKSKDDELMPEGGGRNIPAPEAKGKPSEVDEKLLEDLGQGLEISKDAEEKDPLLRAGRRMRDAEQRLNRKQSVAATRDLQKKIVADLDELLRQDSDGGGSNSKNQKQQKAKSSRQQMARQQGEKASAKVATRPASRSGERPGGARQAPEERGVAPSVRAVWGHLSSLDHQELSQYAKEQFLPKYRELLEQYYTTISSRSRGKSE